MLARLLRANWREIAWCAIWTVVAVFDHHGGLFLALFCTAVVAIGWLMHWGRGRSALEEQVDRNSHVVEENSHKVDRMTGMVGEMVEEMRDGRGEEETPRPHLHLVP